MKIIYCISLLILLFSCSNEKKQKETTTEIFTTADAQEALQFSASQYQALTREIPDSLLPKTLNKDGSIRLTGIYDWVSGFYPGTLWYLFEYTGDSTLFEEAKDKTWLLEPLKDHTGTHDLGFMVFCSYGNALRVTGNEAYKAVIVDAASSLCSRYNETAGVIKSWDWTRDGDWSYPVIIDNMMNLEMLTFSSQVTGVDRYRNIAKSHADTTLKYHFRDNYSTWHVVDYDTVEGGAKGKMTHQGFSDESAWARGQCWGLYGYTMMFRETKDSAYLQQATRIANFILNHPNLPEDKVPYWDFDAPDAPNAKRDASSAAIAASALLELEEYVGDSLSTAFRSNALQMLASLSSTNYRANGKEGNKFVLKHSVGHLPGNVEVNVPLTYADYYYVEALLRFLSDNGAFTFKSFGHQ